MSWADEAAKLDYSVDPNFTGAFPGGPPTLSAEQIDRLCNNREQVLKDIDQAVEALFEQFPDLRELVESN